MRDERTFCCRPVAFLDRRLPSWERVAEWNRSRIVRSSYFWFVAVPIIARLFSGVQSSDDPIIVLGHELTLGLPFSWWMFFFSAIAFAIGRSIYLVACPELIQRYRGYVEFQDDGHSELLIKSAYNESLAVWSPPNDRTAVLNFTRRFCDSAEWDRFPWHPSILKQHMGNAFHFVRSELGRDKLFCRALCVFMFGIGWLAVLAVSIETVWFVFCYLFSEPPYTPLFSQLLKLISG